MIWIDEMLMEDSNKILNNIMSTIITFIPSFNTTSQAYEWQTMLLILIEQ